MNPDDIVDNSYRELVSNTYIDKIRILEELCADAAIDHELMYDENQIITYEDATNICVPGPTNKPFKKDNVKPAKVKDQKVKKNQDTSFRDLFINKEIKPTAPPSYESTEIDGVIKEEELRFNITDINNSLKSFDPTLKMVIKDGQLHVVKCDENPTNHKSIQKEIKNPVESRPTVWIFKNKIFGEYRISDSEIQSLLRSDNPNLNDKEAEKFYLDHFMTAKDVIGYLKTTKKYRNIDQMIVSID